MRIRTILADDHHLIRAGLKALLEQEGDFEVVAEVGDGQEAVARSFETKPDVVIMDLMMPRLNGIEATRRILKVLPDLGVLILSMYSGKQHITRALEAGARGYLLKSAAADDLAVATRAVAAGQSYLSPQISSVVIHDYRRLLEESKGSSSAQILTAREREVLQLLAEGNSSKTIAVALQLSKKTVDSHRAQIMAKLDLHSVAELTRYAIGEGMISPVM